MAESQEMGFSLDKYDCPTIIPYFGGKVEISKQLVPLMPDHVRYFEPFAGGLSTFFRKPKSDINILNDLDKDLANLYFCVVVSFDEFIDKSFWLPKSRELFNKIKQELKNSDFDIPNVNRAVFYYYMIHNAFNKVAFGTFSKDCTNWKTTVTQTLSISRRKLDGCVLENMDIFDLFDKYNVEDGDFIYLDPPYVVADKRKDYYRHVFDKDKHEKLRGLIDKIDDNGGKFMMSYDDKPIIYELYGDRYPIETINTKYYGATLKEIKDATETVITNYEVKHSNQLKLFEEEINGINNR